MQPKYRSHLGIALALELSKPICLFDPAKHLLDPLSGVDGLDVSLMVGTAAINR